MRDIRQDLRDRLGALAAERGRLDRREEVLRRLLAEEEERSAHEPSLFSHTTASEQEDEEANGFRAFLVEALSDGQEWSLGRLKEWAAVKALNFNGKSPGQSLHGTLVSMKRSGLVDQAGKGRWRLPKRDAPPAETDGAP